jgi:hypothetical protein
MVESRCGSWDHGAGLWVRSASVVHRREPQLTRRGLARDGRTCSPSVPRTSAREAPSLQCRVALLFGTDRHVCTTYRIPSRRDVEEPRHLLTKAWPVGGRAIKVETFLQWRCPCPTAALRKTSLMKFFSSVDPKRYPSRGEHCDVIAFTRHLFGVERDPAAGTA